MRCPLCQSASIEPCHRDARRTYFRCGECTLIHADPSSRLRPEEEKAVYDLHQNSPEDSRYRLFLRRLASPLLERLESTGLRGLDFGSGPGPTLSVMLTEQGCEMSIYDPFYAPETSVLRRQYDFITCTEAIEHFHEPAREWRMLLDLLRPGGWLAIMTRLTPEAAAFPQWHYKNDPTHVSFFSRRTFEYLAARDGLRCEFVGADVILLLKPRVQACS